MLKDAVPAKHSQLDEAIGLVPQLEDNPAAQDRFAQLVLSTLDGSQIDATEGLQRIQEQNGSTLFAKLLPPIILPTAKQDDDGDDGGSVTSLDDVATTGRRWRC